MNLSQLCLNGLNLWVVVIGGNITTWCSVMKKVVGLKIDLSLVVRQVELPPVRSWVTLKSPLEPCFGKHFQWEYCE